jgi:hypothetical protein
VLLDVIILYGAEECVEITPLKLPLKKTTKKTVPIEEYLGKRNEFFMEIWKERPHVCEHCGTSLGNEPLSYMFDHILEKFSHADLFFVKDNMWLVCLACHDNKTRGILTDKYKEKINFVKTKFDRS